MELHLTLRRAAKTGPCQALSVYGAIGDSGCGSGQRFCRLLLPGGLGLRGIGPGGLIKLAA